MVDETSTPDPFDNLTAPLTRTRTAAELARQHNTCDHPWDAAALVRSITRGEADDIMEALPDRKFGEYWTGHEDHYFRTTRLLTREDDVRALDVRLYVGAGDGQWIPTRAEYRVEVIDGYDSLGEPRWIRPRTLEHMNHAIGKLVTALARRATEDGR